MIHKNTRETTKRQLLLLTNPINRRIIRNDIQHVVYISNIAEAVLFAGEPPFFYHHFVVLHNELSKVLTAEDGDKQAVLT